jgi:Flp pilus assembly protein TadD
VDYYTILGAQRNASASDIRKAYETQSQIWRIRAASSDASVSAEAKNRLALIEQAFKALSNPQQRAAYDRQPIALTASASPVAPAPTTLPDNTLQRAEYYLEQGDYHAAAGAAKEAQATQPNSAETWSALARANAGLSRFDEAIYEGRRAIELAPQDSEHSFNLGFIYELAGRKAEAAQAYQQASALDSQEPIYQLALGGVLADSGQLQQALNVIESAYRQHTDDQTACYYYARILILMAESVPQDKSSDGYAVTSEGEIQRMREYLGRATAVRHLDQETRQGIQQTEAYLQKMEGRTFHIPFMAISAFGGIYSIAGGAGEGGVAVELFMLLLAGIVVALLAFAPLWIVIWGISSLSSGQLGGILLLLVGGGLGYVWYRALWVPRWKANARKRKNRVRYAA